MSASSSSEYVFLKCVKQSGKLRIKVTSDGYLKSANTQFPRDLRKEGCCYRVLVEDIKLLRTRGQYFYSVKKRSSILIVSEEDVIISSADLSKIKIHTDDDSDECVICMVDKKQIVFGPCGHYFSCKTCSEKCVLCPICRCAVTDRLDRSLFEQF
jgi:hypothetical protein